ncbi:MAG: NAD-glutamate dehydrogenase [Campylobacterales bacterium]|nr:NAD-glutamate dehydrogenase [Campylobacterales bacterium]
MPHTDPLSIPLSQTERALLARSGIITLIDAQRSTLSIASEKPRTLSQMMPLLDDFGFDIIDETSDGFEHEERRYHLYRFGLQIDDPDQFAKAQSNIAAIVTEALGTPHFKRCKLFALIYRENFTPRQVQLMRALIEYLNQAAVNINHEAFIQTFTTHHAIVKSLLEYFTAKFDPAFKRREEALKKIEKRLDEQIKEVPSITDDKILKLAYALLGQMLRTNYFMERETIACKINTQKFAENLKGVQPNLETFVFDNSFSGLHLRMSRISRGGLRWSERHEDYRQEIKSLMITQQGKNAIIVPDGAKGGFVIRKPREAIDKAEFERVYRAFIHNLLDLVDNLKEGRLERDERIVAYDEEDTYFVVAADKGTAAMSDTANAVALERGYWLGDAFASGGSNGYGHKELGITAKGALVSTKRFFIEQGIDFTKSPITVVGIGSMNGDVFGNGMLESPYLKLIGAISTAEVFIDPDPDLHVAYEERKRLFAAKAGGWNSYNPQCISEGGGVFLRAQKSIELSPQIKKLLKTARKAMSGEELARALLTLESDLLFNGGVGTYVKSSEESNLDLGDKQNEAVRIDASELRARCVCEGGNLGFTQKARIEYALMGGKINLDGIDNAAGVNTSDHEVNLKILLSIIRSKGLLDAQECRTLLLSLSDQVLNSVLWSNYAQSLALSRDERRSRLYPDYFISTIEILEQHLGLFKRKEFYIPKNENMREILSQEGGIVRPVLGSLLSYAKLFLKSLLLRTPLIDEAFATDYLFKYFPKSIVSVYDHEIKQHPLRREITATVIANTLINYQGSSFIGDYAKLGEARFLRKIKSYLICNRLFDANNIRFELYRNDYLMDTATQYRLLGEIEHVLNFSTRWMVRYLDDSQIDAAHILDYKTPLFELLHGINPKNAKSLIEGNERFNDFFGHLEYLRFAIATIMIKEQTHHSYPNVGALFFKTVDRFEIVRLLGALERAEILSDDERALKRQLIGFIELIVSNYTKKLLAFQRIGESAPEAFESYIANNPEHFGAIQATLECFLAQESSDIKRIAVTVNELLAAAI